MNEQKLIVIYDGQCPFCSSYVKLMDLREAVGLVDLIDARSDDPRVQRVRDQGYDLNEGMIAEFGSKIYYGSDAMSLISSLGSRANILQRIVSRLLSSPLRARTLYPALRLGRCLTLFAMRRKQI